MNASRLGLVASISLLLACGGGSDDEEAGEGATGGASGSAGTSSAGGGSVGGASGAAGAGAAGKSGAGASAGGNAGGAGKGGTSAGGTSAGGTSAGGTSAGGTSAGGTSAGGTSAGGTSAGGTSAGGTSAGGSAGKGGTSAGGTGGASGSAGQSSDVCTRWKTDRADLAEGKWTGSAQTCDAGDVLSPGRENTLKLLNLYRFLCGLPEVTNDPTRDADAQKCSLMEGINGGLNHSPPMSWKCWSSQGASSAGKSNISPTPSVAAIDLYMQDPGNDTTLGHRRWLLSNSLGPVGIGSSNGASCLQVIGGSGKAGKPWLAYPPPGTVPFEAAKIADKSGWSLQSDSVSLAGAKATVTENGADKPVAVASLQGGYGSKEAIKITPQGWGVSAGKTYAVTITGASTPIAYTFDVVACP